RQVDADGIHIPEASRAVHADARGPIEAGEAAEKSVGHEPRGIRTDEEIDPISERELALTLQRPLGNEIKLVEPVAVGPPAEVRAEVDPIVGAGGISGKALLDPAVDARVDGFETVADPRPFQRLHQKPWLLRERRRRCRRLLRRSRLGWARRASR